MEYVFDYLSFLAKAVTIIAVLLVIIAAAGTRVSPRSADPLDVNSVFTVEPGIYLSGWGGVRIEDIVILGETGATPLSKASK